MLPKLRVPSKNRQSDSLFKDKEPQHQNHLASHLDKLTQAITNLCGLLQSTKFPQQQPQQVQPTQTNNPPLPYLPHLPAQQKNQPTSPKLQLQQQNMMEQKDVGISKEIPVLSQIQVVNQNQDIQERFREVSFQIGKIGRSQDRKKEIKKFLANMVSRVLTRGFYYYEKGLFNDKKYRNFCCSNIISKLIEFAKINQINQDEFNFIGDHLRQKVLPYQKCTYAKAQSQEINLKLSEAIYEINNLSANQNDLVFQSKISFRKKASGDYTSEIMKFINFIIQRSRLKIHQEGEEKEQALSESFFKQMTEFFSMVYQEKWVLKAKKNDPDFNYLLEDLQSKQAKKIQDEIEKKQQYEKKVKSYTKFEIGVKISENVREFSSKNIAEENLELTNAGLMRVLTKWSEELEEYIFNTHEKVINREENFTMLDGSESYLSQSQRLALAIQLQAQKPKIQKYLQQMKKNMSQNQFKSLKSTRIEQFQQFTTEKDANIGCFSTMTHKSNANYLVNYLNKLIDCILSAQVSWYSQMGYEELSCAYLIPNLISFKIGDLMRCKISSKENEIAALFNYLNYISHKFPQKLEITRIKNKLRQGTKDVLINLKYKKSIIVQIQLAIEQQKSTFIQCSQKANHFIYELERARFGPISEICNIWCTSDERYKYFWGLFQEVYMRPVRKEFRLCGHRMREERFPIWCEFCEGFISNLSGITPHLKCDTCMTSICFKCQCKYGDNIIPNTQKLDKAALVTGKQRNGTYQIVKVVDIHKKVKAEKEYILLRLKNEYAIFEKQGQNEYEIKFESQNHKKITKYFSNLLILQSTKGSSQSVLQYLKSEYFRRYFQKARTQMSKIIIYEGKASLNLIQSQRYGHVKKLCLIGAELQNIGEMPNIFPVCQIAILNKNRISDFNNIDKWKTLNELHLQQNSITSISELICQLPNLRKLDFYENKITIVPDKIGNLVNLVDLDLNGNGLTKLPQSMKKLSKLRELNIMWNRLTELPESLFDGMKDLRKILCKQNQLTSFPMGVAKLQNLEQLFLGCNKIASIQSDQVFRCQKLKMIILRQNKLTSVPKFIGDLQHLEEINMEENYIESVEGDVWRCKSLRIVNLSINNLPVLPKQLASCKNIQKISAHTNKISRFEQAQWSLSKLKTLHLKSNELKAVPKAVGGFLSLTVLQLEQNPISEIEPTEWTCLDLLEFNLFQTNICFIPKFISSFKKLRKFEIGNSQTVEIELPEQLLECSQELTLVISSTFTIKPESQNVYDHLNNAKRILRKTP